MFFKTGTLTALLLFSTAFLQNGCSSRRELSENKKPIIETLVKSSMSWSGETYAYPEGKAELTLLRITTPAGFRTPVHTHPQPGVAYVIKGLLECVVSADKTLIAGEGDSFATSYGNVPHYCQNIGDEEALILVAYAGVDGLPITTLKE